jgi:hypothetical protein
MFKNFTTTKNWFMVGSHEYSTNLRYFKEHQLGITQDGLHVKFYSMLESDKVFLEIDMGDLPNYFQGADEEKFISDIHTKLLRGEYGDGKYVD